MQQEIFFEWNQPISLARCYYYFLLLVFFLSLRFLKALDFTLSPIEAAAAA